MGPYILLASALVLLGVAIWLWEAGQKHDDSARILLLWLALSAVTALIAAAAMWIGDRTISLSFSVVARIIFMVIAFLLFLFARSFSVAADYTILFWSVPLQLGIAVASVNWQHMFERSGGYWILDLESPAVMIVIAVSWFYGIMALTYAILLYMTLRREGRENEKSRTLIMIAAMVVLFAASVARSIIITAAGYAIGIAYLGYLAGLLMLLWAIRGPLVFRPMKR